MMFKTLCPDCQKQLADVLQTADNDNPALIANFACLHHGVGIEVVLSGGVVAVWTIFPIKDAADFEHLVANSRALLPAVFKGAFDLAAKKRPADVH